MPTLPDFDPPDAPDLTDPEQRGRWHITDARSAEWVMRKLARYSRLLAEQTELRQEYRQQLDAWWTDATSGLVRDVEWAQGALKAWALELRRQDPESKTQQLPSGTVATRWNPPRLAVTDPGLVAESLAKAHHPNYDAVIKPRVDVDMRELAKVAEVADEWLVDLDCGCGITAWQVGGQGQPVVGQEWPWRDQDHEPRHSQLGRAIRVSRLNRGRIGAWVTATTGPEGMHVRPLKGVETVAGTMSATPTPRA